MHKMAEAKISYVNQLQKRFQMYNKTKKIIREIKYIRRTDN